MLKKTLLPRGANRLGRLVCLSCYLAAVALMPSPAEASDLAPQTKLKLTVVQWMPMDGDYKSWDALGGEFVVGPEGNITVPVIGTMSVLDMTTETIAGEIAKRLAETLGLKAPPSVSVQILEYPPIYVVGAVTKPGSYGFQPGLTALQALAMGGGDFRSTNVELPSDRLKIEGELQGVAEDILRTRARIARLQAQFSSAAKIDFPEELTRDANRPEVKEIMAQERSILDAKLNEIKRQSTSFDELSTLISAEIDVLQTKTADLDKSITRTEAELDGVRNLVEKGIATVSRRSDLELNVASLRADRLDQLTATMRARQNQSEAERNLAGLADQQRTEVAQALQIEQTNLHRLMLQQQTAESVRKELDRKAMLEGSGDNLERPKLIYTIVRHQEDGQIVTFDAEETTLLMPSDVIKISFANPADKAAEPANQ